MEIQSHTMVPKSTANKMWHSTACCGKFCFFSQRSESVEATHIFPDELGDGAGQHEAGDSAAQDVEDGVHDARAGG